MTGMVDWRWSKEEGKVRAGDAVAGGNLGNPGQGQFIPEPPAAGGGGFAVYISMYFLSVEHSFVHQLAGGY